MSSKQIVSIYDKDAEIVKFASSGLQAYIGTTFPPFFVQMMLMGLISAVGIQSETQVPAIFCFLFICIPAGYYLAFTLHMGMQGIFYGQAIGQVILTLFYFKICYEIDWEVQVEEIKRQNQQTENQKEIDEDVDEDKKSLLTTSRYSENEISHRLKEKEQAHILV